MGGVPYNDPLFFLAYSSEYYCYSPLKCPYSVDTHSTHLMFLISGSPANTILRPIVDLLADLTPTQVEDFVREYYDEEWFNSTTPSLRGNDNRLNHRIRSIRAQMGITN